jgi:hypothetical protein
MVIDSIEGNPFQLPLQAWPMAMAPAYGMGGALTPQGLSQASPLTALVYSSGSPVPQGLPGPMAMPLVPFQVMPMPAPSQTTLQAEQQAVDGFLREATAGPIRKLHDYLDAHSQKYSQLAQCIPLVQQAATAFGAHDYTQALAQIYQVYRYIAALRTSLPDLPSL